MTKKASRIWGVLLCSCLALTGDDLLPSAPKFPIPPLWPGAGRITPELEHQYVFLDHAGEEIVIRVSPDTDYVKSGKPSIIRYDLHKHFRPTVRAQVTNLSTGKYAYEYVLANGSSSLERIHTWRVVIPSDGSDATQVVSPNAWGGAASTAPAVFRNVEMPDQPMGRVAVWVRRDTAGNIGAGESRGGFHLESVCRPGFTTALVGSGESAYFDQELPQEVFEQLKFYDAAWQYVPILGFGPMFCPGVSRQQMIRNMISGITRATETNRLSSNSEFAREALAQLNTLASDDAATPVLVHAPSSEFEEEISRALQLSLSFRIAPR
jgi:hypothetical protein